LKAVELLPEVEKSYAENKIDLMLMGDWREYQKLIEEETNSFLDGSNKHYDLVDDMISDLASWSCFKEPQEFVREFDEAEIEDDFESEEDIIWHSRSEGTFVRETPKVGKNEPCPCGSGRKYKKCCMNKN
jgi:preprotein translocase subunit SecA